MTKKDYLEQNLKGFENDSFARAKFASIISEHKIETVIETGTYLGSTTIQLAYMCNNVITIEVNRDHFNQAFKNIADKEIAITTLCPNDKLSEQKMVMRMGSSELVLKNILPGLKNRKIFFFLDAHWGEYNPLIDELKEIANNQIKPVIAIHDFKVPGHPELGFDTYGDIVYEWDWIKESVEKIYGENGYTIEYNSKATGAQRGIIYIYPAS